MMNLAMNFDTDECLVPAMFDKGNGNDTMDAIGNTIRKLFCMSDEGYEIFLMDLEDYKADLEDNYKK